MSSPPKTIVLEMPGQALTSAIVFAGIIVVAFAFTGRWPHQSMLLGASMGGAISPLFWKAVRAILPEPAPEAEKPDSRQ